MPVTHSADCSQDSESLQTGNQCFEITIFSPSHLHWAALLSTSQCLCQWKSQMKSWGFSHSYEWCFCSSAHQVCAFVFSGRRYKSSQDFCKIHCHSYLELRYISYKSSRGGRKHFLTPDISKFIFSSACLNGYDHVFHCFLSSFARVLKKPKQEHDYQSWKKSPLKFGQFVDIWLFWHLKC